MSLIKHFKVKSMNRLEYLESEPVENFIDYLNAILDKNDTFHHQFEIKDCPGKWGMDWQQYNGQQKLWSVHSLKDAFDKYYWPSSNGPSYEENKLILDDLSTELNGDNKSEQTEEMALFMLCIKSGLEADQKSKTLLTIRTTNALVKAFKSPEQSIKNEICKSLSKYFKDIDHMDFNVADYLYTGEESKFIAAIKTLDWGGVLKGNKSEGWLYKQYKQNQLTDKFRAAAELLIGDNESDVKASFKKDYWMNSGMTKIYSLYSGTSIIYDGRVGAALGLLVTKFLELNKIYDLPDELEFYWGDDSGGNGTRNPSTSQYKFKQLRSDSSQHALMNLRANWILSKLIENKIWGLDTKEERLRAIEASLFMIGYKVIS
jgi:hypothetical protein